MTLNGFLSLLLMSPNNMNFSYKPSIICNQNSSHSIRVFYHIKIQIITKLKIQRINMPSLLIMLTSLLDNDKLMSDGGIKDEQ